MKSSSKQVGQEIMTSSSRMLAFAKLSVPITCTNDVTTAELVCISKIMHHLKRPYSMPIRICCPGWGHHFRSPDAEGNVVAASMCE